MTNEEKILQLLEAQQKTLEAQQAELRKISAKMDAIQEDIDQLKEDSEVTRSGVNALIEWAEDVSNAIRFPLPKLK